MEVLVDWWVQWSGGDEREHQARRAPRSWVDLRHDHGGETRTSG